MSKDTDYQGSCFCGKVQFTLRGKPEIMAYCHCQSCRHWSAGPVNAFTLWKPEAMQITKGTDSIAAFSRNPGTQSDSVISDRKWCRHCAGHLYTDHPQMGLVDVPSAVLSRFDFTPAFHVHYQETVHGMKDGLPKFKDLPAEAGGSGVLLAE